MIIIAFRLDIQSFHSFSEAKVTEIYCTADDFCKEFALKQETKATNDGSFSCKVLVIKFLRINDKLSSFHM